MAWILVRYTSVRRRVDEAGRRAMACPFLTPPDCETRSELYLFSVVLRFRNNFHGHPKAVTTVYIRFFKISSANNGERTQNGSRAKPLQPFNRQIYSVRRWPIPNSRRPRSQSGETQSSKISKISVAEPKTLILASRPRPI